MASSEPIKRQASSAVASPTASRDGSSPAVLPTYARQDLIFSRGEGTWLVTPEGERYLDLASGVAVNALGHAHPRLVAALAAQAGKLWHTSNLYRVEGQERVAERLVELTFADKVFFCNSGAEACEGAIKTARRYHHVGGHPERWRIVTFEGAFHGRTIATLAAGGNPKYLEGFGPAADGFDQVPFGDHEALERAIGPETAAIMIEPVQGEGGVRTVPDQCLKGLRDLCDENGLLLILDEVQSGMGRTGRLFAHEWAGITPDIMAIAKGLGGGFPVGAFLVTDAAARGMTAGTHGSTFGGNPLAMAVADTVIDVVSDREVLRDVERKALREICDEFGLLLFFDEVQCGMGRTGRLFAHEWAGIAPDVMATAKGIGGGFPLGACLATAKASAGMTAGTHGSTYGGNPLAMAVGNAVLDVMLAPGFLEGVERTGRLLKGRLEELARRHPKIFAEARGEGLILGLRCEPPAGELQVALRAAGLLTVTAGENVIRIVPPLVIGEAEVAEAVAIIDQVAARYTVEKLKGAA